LSLNYRNQTLISMKTFCSFLLLVIASFQLKGQDLVYRAKNPAFGGETFNYQWLLSGAQAQDTYPNPELASFTSGSGNNLNNLKESLNRQLLSRLSSQLITNQFGESDLQPGSYVIGDYQVDVSNTSDGVLIDVLDQATGQSTQLLIPFF
jgi:curli production assembly/transport component CsgF